MMDPARKRLLDRVAKLLSLAESTTFDGEAQAARAAALRLMAEHNIRAGDASEAYEVRFVKAYFKEDVWWDRIVKFSLARLNNCAAMLTHTGEMGEGGTIIGGEVTGHRYVGRSADLDAFQYMFGIVLQQRTRAWNDYAAGGGREPKGKWLFGYARGLQDKVAGMLADLERGMRSGGHADLTPDRQIAVIQRWYEEHYGEVHSGLENPGGGARDGYRAGGSANLYRGEVGQQRRLGVQRRLGYGG